MNGRPIFSNEFFYLVPLAHMFNQFNFQNPRTLGLILGILRGNIDLVAASDRDNARASLC